MERDSELEYCGKKSKVSKLGLTNSRDYGFSKSPGDQGKRQNNN